MDIVKNTICNNIIGAPSDMQDGSCSALPIHEYEDEKGNRWAVSFWKPDQDELTALVSGGIITLHIRAAGRQHPVVGMGVESGPAFQPIPA